MFSQKNRQIFPCLAGPGLSSYKSRQHSRKGSSPWKQSAPGWCQWPQCCGWWLRFPSAELRALVNKLQSTTDQVQNRSEDCTWSHTAILQPNPLPQSMPSCKPQATSQYWPVLFTDCLVHHSWAARQEGENKTAQSKKFKKCTNLRLEIRKNHNFPPEKNHLDAWFIWQTVL